MDRTSDAGGKAYWMEALANGVSREYVFRGFAMSQEYTNICNKYDIGRGSVTLTQARVFWLHLHYKPLSTRLGVVAFNDK